MTKKQQSYNWFGIEDETLKKRKYTPFSFLGTVKTPKQRNAPGKISFLGKSNKQIKMTPSPLFRKESIKHKRKLSKFGDADFDGTPNYFDCDPTNFLKDAKLGKKIKEAIATTRQYISQRGEERQPGRQAGERTLTKVERAEREYQQAETESKQQKEEMKDFITQKKERIEKLKSEGKKVSRDEVKELKRLEKDFKASSKKLDKGLKERKQYLGKIRGAAESYIGLEAAAKLGGPAGTVAMKGLAIKQKLEAGTPVSQKQIKAFIEAQKETSVGARAKRAATFLGVGGVTGVLAGGYGLTKKGTYTKEMIARAARVRKLTKGALGLAFGPSLTAKGFSSEPRGRGRPAGPSGEYKIGGKPVYEEEYRQWQAKQNALNRMLPSEAQSQTLNPEYLEYIKAQQMQQQMQAQQQAQSPQETMGPEEGMNEPVPSDQAPKTEGMTNEEVQAIEEAKRRPYVRAQPDEIKQAQYTAQQKDQVLNAPNFMKGELKAAGGSILTPNGPQIMDAPNVFKGEMRNVYSDGETPAVRLSERPQTNPYGDEYLEIELGSGKPVVRRRIREKWMTGEAL